MMKRILICDENKADIEYLLDYIQGNYKVRLITFDKLLLLSKKLDEQLFLKNFKGYNKIRYHYHENGTPKEYKYDVPTTHIVLEHGNNPNEWYLIDCRRIKDVSGKPNESYFIQNVHSDIIIKDLN